MDPSLTPVAPADWTTSTNPVPSLTSAISPETSTGTDFRDALVASGAAPTPVDTTAMLLELQKQQLVLQAKYDALMAEKGIPTDPIAAGVKDLLDHLYARSSQYPLYDFSNFIDKWRDQDGRERYALKNISTPPHPTETNLIMMEVEDLLTRYPHGELGYIRELARNLHREVLKASK